MKKRDYSALGYLGLFMLIGFVMKITSEVVHEILGHGLFVTAFGGAIEGVYISLLWPYEMSSISWTLPPSITWGQMSLIYSGGITVSMVLSLVLELFLWSKKSSSLWIDLPLFWLAFWCMVNATGYLIIGGFHPFGDMQWLTASGYIAPIVAIATGAIFFFFSFSLLSRILRRNLVGHLSLDSARLGTVVFWFIIPMLVVLIVLGLGAPLYLAFVPVSLIPIFLSWAMEYWFNRKKN